MLFKIPGEVSCYYNLYTMIILRQKNYSNRYTRALAGINKNVLRKSPMQAKRSAIKTQNKALETKAKLVQTAETASNEPRTFS